MQKNTTFHINFIALEIEIILKKRILKSQETNPQSSSQERDIYSLGCSSYEEGDNLWSSYAKESKRLTDSLDKCLPSHPRHITSDFLKKKLNEQTNKFNKEIQR